MSGRKMVLLITFLLAFVLPHITPIYEGDFFYHLKSGEDIIKTGVIPAGFPSQWLGQVLIYLIYQPCGFAGVVIFRSGVYAFVLSLLSFWMLRQGIGVHFAIFFLLFPAHMFLSFPSERPQLFSFLLFPLIVYLLELYRENEKTRHIWFVPFIILIWANIHAGFTIGVMTVWIYFIAGIIGYVRKKRTPTYLLKIAALALSPALLLVIKPSVIFSVIDLFRVFLFPSAYMKSIQEYLSPLSAAMELNEYYPAYWLFMAISIFAIIKNIRNMPLEHILMLVAFGLLPFWGLRFMPFFVMLVPLASLYIIPKNEATEGGRLFSVGFLVILALWFSLVPINLGLGISSNFPVKAMAFISNKMPSGKIFNYHGWGGYINWKVPDKEIFIPVNNIRDDVDQSYDKIIWADTGASFGGKSQWQALLDAYKLDLIIIPGMSPVSGEVFGIVDAIQGSQDWYLIYQDEISNILVKATPSNMPLISRYSIPKSNMILQIISQAKKYLETEPERKVLWKSLGESYARLGMKKEAGEAFKKAK